MLIPLLIAIAAFPQQDYGEHHARVLESVERRYSEFAKAILRHDMTEVLNYMTYNVVWIEKHDRDTKTIDRDAIVQRLQPWVKSTDPKGVLRFHVNRMNVKSDDEVETEIEVQYAPQGVPFPPKVKEKNIWRETLVKVSDRWMLQRGQQISPKMADSNYGVVVETAAQGATVSR